MLNLDPGIPKSKQVSVNSFRPGSRHRILRRFEELRAARATRSSLPQWPWPFCHLGNPHRVPVPTCFKKLRKDAEGPKTEVPTFQVLVLRAPAKNSSMQRKAGEMKLARPLSTVLVQLDL